MNQKRNSNSGWKTPLTLTTFDFSKVILAGVATVGFAAWYGVEPLKESNGLRSVREAMGGFHQRRDFVEPEPEDDAPVLMGGLSRVATLLGIPTATELSQEEQAKEKNVTGIGLRRRRHTQQLHARTKAAERRHEHSERSLRVARSKVSELESSNTTLQSSLSSVQRELASREAELRSLRLAVARTAEASVEMVDDLIRAVEEELRDARFDGALELAEEANRVLERSDAADAKQRLARLELARATAQVALGESSDAAASLGRALDADPALKLDPRTSSPKLLRAYDEALSER